MQRRATRNQCGARFEPASRQASPQPAPTGRQYYNNDKNARNLRASGLRLAANEIGANQNTIDANFVYMVSANLIVTRRVRSDAAGRNCVYGSVHEKLRHPCVPSKLLLREPRIVNASNR